MRYWAWYNAHSACGAEKFDAPLLAKECPAKPRKPLLIVVRTQKTIRICYGVSASEFSIHPCIDPDQYWYGHRGKDTDHEPSS